MVGTLVALVALVALTTACVDVRDFAGDWSGDVAAVKAPLRVGFAEGVSLDLEVERADLVDLKAVLSTSDGRFDRAEVAPIPGTQADVTAEITFGGSPTRVYLAFATPTDGAGDALVLVALFPDDRVTVRVARQGGQPLYGIFTLRR